MAGIRAGGRLKLSPKAQEHYRKASKIHGGQTKLLEESIEYFVSQGALDIQKELNEIRWIVFQLAVHNGIDVGLLNQNMCRYEPQIERGIGT
ncbi:hypothetical protein D3C74_435480 [compost metagenome]